MIASNINVDQLINTLLKISNSGISLINLEISKDEISPTMNKLTIVPIRYIKSKSESNGSSNKGNKDKEEKESDIVIRDPDIDIDSDDIFNMLNDAL